MVVFVLLSGRMEEKYVLFIQTRNGNINSPQWKKGTIYVSNLIIVQAHGPRGPKSLYYMLPFSLRVFGLTNTLTIKFIQVLY